MTTGQGRTDEFELVLGPLRVRRGDDPRQSRVRRESLPGNMDEPQRDTAQQGLAGRPFGGDEAFATAVQADDDGKVRGHVS